jgi:hypothetical protein
MGHRGVPRFMDGGECSVLGALVNVNNPSNMVQRGEAAAAAAKLGAAFAPVELRTPDEIGSAFQALLRERPSIVLYGIVRHLCRFLCGIVRHCTALPYQLPYKAGSRLGLGLDPLALFGR